MDELVGLLKTDPIQPGEINQLNKELQSVYKSVTSPEVKAVKEKIQEFRSEAGVLTVGMKDKADKIEKELCEIPVTQRIDVISSPDGSKLKTALAGHRHFFRHSPNLDTNENTTTHKPARTFTDFKTRFQNATNNVQDDQLAYEDLIQKGSEVGALAPTNVSTQSEIDEYSAKSTNLLQQMQNEVIPANSSKGYSDKLQVYIDNKMDEFVGILRTHPIQAERINQLNVELEAACKSVISPEVKAVKEKIQEFRSQAGVLTVGMKDKADKIEEELCKIPITQRINVISSPEGNKVKTALASHRHISRESPNLDKNEREASKAASAFKDLKEKFQGVMTNVQVAPKPEPEHEPEPDPQVRKGAPF
jgi:hypothetical protein